MTVPASLGRPQCLGSISIKPSSHISRLTSSNSTRHLFEENFWILKELSFKKLVFYEDNHVNSTEILVRRNDINIFQRKITFMSTQLVSSYSGRYPPNTEEIERIYFCACVKKMFKGMLESI
jgi:hypothetical protein